MKTISFGLALSALVCGFVNTAPAVAETAPFGSTIVCPSVLLAGKPATVSVVHQGKPASGVTVQTDSGTTTTDASGRCTLNVPGEAKTFDIKLQRADSTIVVKPT